MKNKLLALMALCGATSSTMPLWAAWEDPQLSFVTPDFDAIQKGSREVYYLYHVASGMFMSNSSTACAVAADGQEVTLSYGTDYELASHAVDAADYSDAQSYRLSMMNAPTNGGFHELYLNGDGVLYVDHNKTGHILWDILPQDDGTYRLQVNQDDPTYGASNATYAGALVGVNQSEGKWNTSVNPLIIPGTAGFEDAAFDWKFVTPEVYEVYKAKLALQEQLNLADERGFTDYSEYAAIYNKEDATPEEIRQAAADLAADLVDYAYSVASEANPADVTSLVKNPSFLDENGAATSDGWTTWRETTVENFQPQAGRYSEFQTPDGHQFGDFFERWTSSGTHGDWYVEQGLEGLPDGKYRLGAYIMTNNIEANGGAAGLFLYARTLGGESATEADHASPDGSTWAFPYSVDFNVIGGTATIGMRSTDYASNWSAVGYFTLQYLGAGEATDIREAVRNNIAEMEQKYTDGVANTPHGQAEDDAYQAMLATAKEAVENTAVTNDSLTSLVKSLQASYDAMTASAAQYVTLDERIQALWDLWEGNAIYKDLNIPDYEDYVGGLQDEYDARTFDMTQLDSIQPRGEQLWKECAMGLLESGETDNATGMLTNPNFSDGNTGWAMSGDGNFNATDMVSEVWNGRNWEVYQEITGLPQGSYKITAQAFYSPSSHNKNEWHENYGLPGDHTSDIHGYLFGNEASVPLVHIMSCPTAEKPESGAFEEITWGSESLMGQFIPNDKASSRIVFEADPTNYLNEVVCYVGEDGVLRLGTKMSGVDWEAAWIVYDNFQVTYLGADDMSGASSALNALIEEATKLLNAESLSTTETRDALNKAIEDATAAAAGDMTPEVYAAQTEALNAAMEAEREAVSEATTLETKVNNENLKFQSTGEGSYVAYEGTEAYDELETIVMDVITTIDNEGIFASREEIKNYNDAINAGCAKMMSALYDFSVASKDAPVEVTNLIYNPSFQLYTMNDDGTATLSLSNDGWTIEGGGGATSGLNFEVFDDSTDIHQTLHGLPAGYYRLVYNGFYRGGGANETALNRRDSVEHKFAEVFVTYDNELWRDTVQTILNVIHDTKYYDGGDIFLADSLFPERQDLVYFLIVNNVTGADKAFKDGKYVNDLSFYVAEGKEPTIGLWKTGMVSNDWVCVDNFQLFYLGDGDANRPDDFVSNVEDVINEGTAEVVSTTWVTLDGVKVNAPTQRGIYIRADKMSDGTLKTTKVLVP